MRDDYSHSYEDPETGDIVDVFVEDYDDDYDYEDYDDLRNAGARDHRSPRGRPRPAGRGGRPRPAGRGGRRAIHRPRSASSPRSPGRSYEPRPVIVQQAADRAVGHHTQDSDEYLSIRKSALVELLPVAGQVWASMVGLPGSPKATGDDVTDRNNAAKHRQALAEHEQNQQRIQTMTNLASRVLVMFGR